MKSLAFDGRTGASGDMILGALLAAGASHQSLDPVEERLDIEYDIGSTVKNGISATRVLVRTTDSENTVDGGDHHHDPDRSHSHAHSYEHEHSHEHDPNHTHDHTHDHAEGGGPHRTYPEVIEIVEDLGLSASVESDAKAIFRLLGEAESEVHDTDLDVTHFHEVGADDAIADIVGACLLIADLDVERIVTTPISVGGGEMSMSHGTYPIPAPAVLNIAARADWELRGGPVEHELLTPTGAAILAHFADGRQTVPTFRVEASGYGAGGYEFSEHPNVLRAIIGHARGGLKRDSIRVLETNLDDATPEILGGLHEPLLDAGARDVSILPIAMKKSRPGHLVRVVVKPENADRVAHRLATETGTLGVREIGVSHRHVAERSFETATIPIDGDSYEVTVKLGSDGGRVYDVSAEYDDARAVADETGVPTREVMRRAETAINQTVGESDR